MWVIGLTGGIASGKSTVTKILQSLGAIILDADLIAREIVEPGKPAWQDIVSCFGRDILLSDGNLDRKKLGFMVFNNKEKLERLNKITHPRIIEKIEQVVSEFRLNQNNKEKNILIVDMPLLYELKLERTMDRVWVVYVDEQEQIARLIKRNNLSLQDATARINSQMPLKEKARIADEVIDNRGTIAQTTETVMKLWNTLD